MTILPKSVTSRPKRSSPLVRYAATMIDRLIFVGLAVLAILGPLGWCVWRDCLAKRDLVIRADVESALREALGGESLVSVEAVAATGWRQGRVVLSVPAGWDCLVKKAWDRVVQKLPAGYELVIRGACRIEQAVARERHR